MTFLVFLLLLVYIYIPIWLDLLFDCYSEGTENGDIYIPIWLDLLLKNGEVNPQGNQRFTFQYG